ncbi:MAG TPA: hypothetical protein VGF67_14940 [Ktedonobacteraceae bacterium]
MHNHRASEGTFIVAERSNDSEHREHSSWPPLTTTIRESLPGTIDVRQLNERELAKK